MEKFRWCFIGTGTLANQVASQLLKSGRHEIVSCYSRNKDRCQKFAEKFGCIAYEDAKEAISNEKVQGVYIVVTHNAHFRFAKLALENKKPVLCEKAFTVSADETEELITLARKNDVYLCEAMWTWFCASANQTKKWIDEGKIGAVKTANFTYHMKSINYAPRVSDPKRAGGALLDITIYPITYAYRLWGYPIKIESQGIISNDIDISEVITLTFNNGVTALIDASIVDFKGFENMKIVGEQGTINAFMYHCMNGITCRKGLFNSEKFKGKGPKFNTYLDEFDAVADDIRNNRKESAMVPLQCTLDVMKIMDEIRKQINLNYTSLE